MARVVTIDGPAGAGKSTAARRLAERLGWRFLDTGALYRAVTLAALEAGIDPACETQRHQLVSSIQVHLTEGAVMLDGRDVSREIRNAVVTDATRFLADSPSVRNVLTTWQRDFAREADVVTEGRDQGTLVFPDAYRKFYLTASDEERARRRLADYQARGLGDGMDLKSVLREIRNRDARDAARAIAPMQPAPDAIVIDTTGLSIDAIIDAMAAEIECRPSEGRA